MKMSLIVFGALAVSFALRQRSAALRHWVLAAGVACAAAVPVLDVRCARVAAAVCHAHGVHVSMRIHSGNRRRLHRSRRAWQLPLLPRRRVSRGRRRCAHWICGPTCRPSGWQERSSASRILLIGVLRLAWLAVHAPSSHARALARPRDGRFRAAMDFGVRYVAAERPSVAARHMGTRAAESDSAGRRRVVDRRARASRAVARARAYPPRRLDRAALGRAAARVLLVQSAALACLPAAQARERACLRRRGDEPRRRGHRLRHSSH